MLLSDFIAYLFNLPLDFFFRHVVMFSCFIEHLFSRFIHAFYYRVVYVKFQFFHSSEILIIRVKNGAGVPPTRLPRLKCAVAYRSSERRYYSLFAHLYVIPPP